MRIAFLVPGLERSGGIDVITGHAARLRASGDAEVDVLPVGEVSTLEGGHYDIAVGTWWETFHRLFDVPADRHAGFLQSFEQRFYRPSERVEQLAAALVYQLPLHYIGASDWICRAFRELRPEEACTSVPNGIDKSVFAPGERRAEGGPLRILVDGQPELWFKGVDDALRAARAMKEPAEVTLVCQNPPQTTLPVDRVVSERSPQEMAELYRETDVVLKMSRVEGLGLVPLEALHCRAPCVVTPYTGHEDYVRHGENGFVCGFDDPATATAYLDRLACDRVLLDRLGAGAVESTRTWPSPEESTRALAGALREIAASPADAPDPAQWARVMATARHSVDVMREEREERAAAHERTRSTLEHALETERQIRENRDHQLELIHASRAYRLSLALRKLLRGR